MEMSEHPAPATIAVFDHVMEAEIAKGRLEAEGIEAFVQDENLVVQNWLYRNAIGGLRLQVAANDADRATEILASMTFDDQDLEPDLAGVEDADLCPSCRSDELEYVRSEKRSAYLSWLLVGFPILARPRQIRCAACSHSWFTKSFGTLRAAAFVLMVTGLFAGRAAWEFQSFSFGILSAVCIVGAVTLLLSSPSR